MKPIGIATVVLFALASPGALAQGSDGNWPAYNRTYRSERFSPLTEITAANVPQLRPVCSYDTDETTSFQTGPVVVDGTMYITTEQNTYAIDAGTCALRWKNEHSAPPGALKVNRGVAYLDGKLFRGSSDGHVFAIDARSGRTLWDVAIADPKWGESVPAAPIAWQGMVFIGNAGGDNFGVTGRIYALDAQTGRQLWRFDMVPVGPGSSMAANSGNAATAGSGSSTQPEHAAAQTWPPPTPEVPRAGGATWTSYTLDTTAGRLYVPGGNAGPDFAKQLRPGENLYTNSVVVLDAKSGTLVDFYPLTPNDFHDWDVSSAPVLVTTQSNRYIVAEAGKDGYLRAVDPASRKILYRVATTTIDNAEAPLTPQGRASARAPKAARNGAARPICPRRTRSTSPPPIGARRFIWRRRSSCADSPASPGPAPPTRTRSGPLTRRRNGAAGSPRSTPIPAVSSGSTNRRRRCSPA